MKENKSEYTKEFCEAFDLFLSEFAKITYNVVIKSLDSCNRLDDKLKELIDKGKLYDREYYEKTYNFLEQLNSLVDDFIKEHK